MERYTSIEITTEKRNNQRKIPQAWKRFLNGMDKSNQQSKDETVDLSADQSDEQKGVERS